MYKDERFKTVIPERRIRFTTISVGGHFSWNFECEVSVCMKNRNHENRTGFFFFNKMNYSPRREPVLDKHRKNRERSQEQLSHGKWKYASYFDRVLFECIQHNNHKRTRDLKCTDAINSTDENSDSTKSGNIFETSSVVLYESVE